MCVASMILVCLVSNCIGLHLTASHLACCLRTGFLRTQPHAGFLFRSEPNQAQQILNVCTLLDEEAGGHILLVTHRGHCRSWPWLLESRALHKWRKLIMAPVQPSTGLVERHSYVTHGTVLH